MIELSEATAVVMILTLESLRAGVVPLMIVAVQSVTSHCVFVASCPGCGSVVIHSPPPSLTLFNYSSYIRCSYKKINSEDMSPCIFPILSRL